MKDLLIHLESYVTLVGHVRRGGRGAFEHAADELDVDRSVLRRRIQALTTWIGAPLFRGRGSALVPTAAGERLATRATSILAATRDLGRDVKSARERVVVACTGTITAQLLPRVLLDLEKGAPVVLVVRRAGGSLCERLVVSGDADVGVVRGDRPPSTLAAQLLAEDRLWLALPVGHPLVVVRERELTPARMAAVPLVLFGESSRTRVRVMDRLGPLGATIRVEVDGRASALEYVRCGLGATFLSLLPGHAVKDEGVVVRDVTAHFERSRFWAVCRPDRRGDPAVDRVLGLLMRHSRRRSQNVVRKPP